MSFGEPDADGIYRFDMLLSPEEMVSARICMEERKNLSAIVNEKATYAFNGALKRAANIARREAAHSHRRYMVKKKARKHTEAHNHLRLCRKAELIAEAIEALIRD